MVRSVAFLCGSGVGFCYSTGATAALVTDFRSPPVLINETLCFNEILLGGQEESFDWKVLLLKGRQSDKSQVKGLFLKLYHRAVLLHAQPTSLNPQNRLTTIFVYKDALNF